MNVPFIDLKLQYKLIQSEIDAAIKQVLDKCTFVQGPFLKKFEEDFADYLGIKHVIGVNSGTSALAISLLALNEIRNWADKKWEAIIPANTFIATAESIIHAGGKPVLVDIDPDTYNIDPNKIEKSINKNTKVIIPVHLYGQPADMRKIVEIAKKNDLLIIEDAAQAHGSEVQIDNKLIKAGTIGVANAFSFYPSKNLGAYGDGGAVVTNDDQIGQFIRMYRDHGSSVKYEHRFIGSTDRLDDLQAAILSVKLKNLDKWNGQRQKNAEIYKKLFSDIENITLPFVLDSMKPVWHLYVIRVENPESLLDHLQKNNIGCGFHYKTPLHLQPALKNLGYKKGDFPVTEKVMMHGISLPMYPELTKKQISFVVEKIKEFLKH
jgi:dTDP-4-amino-4,6-dideoxygalactose transaminase